jgi:CheY-like chemotaxis protein
MRTVATYCRRQMSQPSRRRATILAIDDDPSILETVTQLLEGEGHRVLTAASGEDGLMVARTITPDLILLDLYMPSMDGLEVVRRLKADPATPTRRIPVVALTSATADHATQLTFLGCVGFIQKPFQPTEFLRIVNSILTATAG